MVLVFKTTVNSQQKIKSLTPYLNQILNDAIWNFDLEDCDRIFRLESNENVSKLIINFFEEKGFDCVELE